MGDYRNKNLTFVKTSFDIESSAYLLVETTMMKDPICGMMVDEKTAKLKSEHEGQTFYFCSAGCKATFDKDPHRYGHQRS